MLLYESKIITGEPYLERLYNDQICIYKPL
nr:MAG TPA: hypothetical protein [Caudoviricetes sp.]